MKLLTATTTGQGERDGDFAWTVEGELIGIDEPCARDARDPDGGCGCGRAFFGMSSHKASTTALVRDLPLTRDDLAQALAGHHESAGWGTPTADELREELDELLDIAATFPVGTVVERRLDIVRSRYVVR